MGPHAPAPYVEAKVTPVYLVSTWAPAVEFVRVPRPSFSLLWLMFPVSFIPGLDGCCFVFGVVIGVVLGGVFRVGFAVVLGVVCGCVGVWFGVVLGAVFGVIFGVGLSVLYGVVIGVELSVVFGA